MNEVVEYKFSTKTGICIITPDKLVLAREGLVGAAAERFVGNSVLRPLVIYSVLAIAILAVGIWYIVNNGYFGGSIFCAIGVLFLWIVISSWNNSAANTIERSSVTSINVRNPHPPFTRGYFVVHFVQNGKKRKRLIMLPGSMSGGNEEYNHALLVMKEAGWIT